MRPKLGQRGDRWCWSHSSRIAEIRFYGRGPNRVEKPETLLERGESNPRPAAAWMEQRHTADALEARPGACGVGDALISREEGLALSVFTADCVPLLLAGGGVVAAVHAGWRGIVRGVVPNALSETGCPASTLTAWLGPAIGACCYEVGPEVAAEVVASSDPEVVSRSDGNRPYLDLHRAVGHQLERAGVKRIWRVETCTRCDGERLWSYRREAEAAGRNISMIWMPVRRGA